MAGELAALAESVVESEMAGTTGTVNSRKDIRVVLDLTIRAAEIMGRNEGAGLSTGDERQWLAEYNAAKGE